MTIPVQVKEEPIEQQVEGEKSKVRSEYHLDFTQQKVCIAFLYDNVCFPHRWSSTCAWYVGVEAMKIDYCFVMGVTTVITLSV